MAKKDEELPVDSVIVGEDPTTDPMPAEVAAELKPVTDKVKAGMIAAMAGTTAELHAIQMRLAEMKPFLSGAIETADGDVKGFLISLSAAL